MITTKTQTGASEPRFCLSLAPMGFQPRMGQHPPSLCRPFGAKTLALTDAQCPGADATRLRDTVPPGLRAYALSRTAPGKSGPPQRAVVLVVVLVLVVGNSPGSRGRGRRRGRNDGHKSFSGKHLRKIENLFSIRVRNGVGISCAAFRTSFPRWQREERGSAQLPRQLLPMRGLREFLPRTVSGCVRET
jgi:hypothetical protein